MTPRRLLLKNLERKILFESLKDYRNVPLSIVLVLALRHPNIIKTIDIIHENNRYFEITEYAPIDFFAAVMSGEMSRTEISCCFKANY